MPGWAWFAAGAAAAAVGITGFLWWYFGPGRDWRTF